MLGLRISGWVFASWLILAGGLGGAASTDSATSNSPAANPSESAGEGSGRESQKEGRHSVECGDGPEPPVLKEEGYGRSDYYDSVLGTDGEPRNGTDSRAARRKCCRWNHYFDVDDFACSPLPENLTVPFGLILEGMKIATNESERFFADDFPRCGNRSVLSVRAAAWALEGAEDAEETEGVLREHCVDGDPRRPRRTVVLACRDAAAFCRARSCFRKCCPLGQAYGPSGRMCQESGRPFRPEFHNLTTLTPVDSAKLSDYGIYLGDACGAAGKYLLEREMDDVSYLGLDGNLFAPAFQKRIFSADEFCVEFVERGNSSRVESFLCFSKPGTRFENSRLQFSLLSVGLFISSAFLMLTFAAYLFSPKSQNLYGKTLMCYVACLCGAYLCLAVIALKTKDVDKRICTSLGYSLLFSFLAAFFWLNVMSFDIWKTFRADRVAEGRRSDGGRLRFLWYSLYAWSFPCAITAACAYVNQLQDFPYEVAKPGIGAETCWFSKRKKGIYLYFITPISLIITCNVIFYLQTARKIWKVKSDVKKMDTQKTKKFSANKEQFIINGKLFIVMGIAWSLEIISFFAPHPIWYVTDAANALHGVFIFAVFVLKRKVLENVSRRMRAPLKWVRQLTASESDDPTGKKTVPDSNAEGRSRGTDASNGF